MSSDRARPARERPQLGPSDAVLGATSPLTFPGPGEQYVRPRPERPQISWAPDAVIGAPLAPPPDGAREGGLQLGVDSAGGYTVAKQLDGAKKPRRRP